MKSIRAPFQVLLLLLPLLYPTSAKNECHICGDAGNSGIDFPTVILKGEGRTCIDIALDIAKNYPPAGEDECITAQDNYWHKCCSGVKPDGHTPPPGLPPQRIPPVRYVGPNDECKICWGGDYPYKTSMVINMLYIGVGSCAQYYKWGMEGRIQNEMCQSLQYFAYEPCGCGEFNPYTTLPDEAPEPENPTPNTARPTPKPNDPDGKDECARLSNGYGGAGGAQCHEGGRKKRRTLLKGS
jgi:hypothetical protein